jgi:putative ABC transport system permease protein
MISGRITGANGVSAEEIDARKRRAGTETAGPGAGSSRNLTWMVDLPEDNEVLEGRWWTPDHAAPPLVSLEQDLASANGFRVGDELTFQIRDQEVKARVASIRRVRWDSMRPNFFIVFAPGTLEGFPSTYMTSLYLDRSQKLFLNRLLSLYPTVTVLEVDAIIEQVRTIIEQVSLAVEVVLALILVSGALVLVASIQASMDERLREHAVLRTLGASRRLILGSLAIEFAVLGTFAGALAAFAAELTVYGLETRLFQLEYDPNPLLWALGPLVGALLVGSIGVWATRRLVRAPPISILRELA